MEISQNFVAFSEYDNFIIKFTKATRYILTCNELMSYLIMKIWSSWDLLLSFFFKFKLQKVFYIILHTYLLVSIHRSFANVGSLKKDQQRLPIYPISFCKKNNVVWYFYLFYSFIKIKIVASPLWSSIFYLTMNKCTQCVFYWLMKDLKYILAPK